MGQDTITVTAGPPAIVSIDPPAAENEVDTEHCVTATVTDAFGNPNQGVKVFFSVTGSNPTAGTATTDANGQAEFCYTGRLIGEDVITATADEDGGQSPEPGDPSGTAFKTWLPPVSTPLCEVSFPTGGGQITAMNADKASFGGNAHVSESGDPSGEQEYQDHGPAEPMNVHSINVLAVVCVVFPDGHAEATIHGEATIDGSGSFAYRIDVEDRGEPGTSDTYWILLSKPYDSGKQTLDSGNIQIHNS